MSVNKWPGRTGWIKWILMATLLFSLVAWALGVAYTVKLTKMSTYASSAPRRPSAAELYFYSSAVPMASMLAAVIDLSLFFAGALLPVITIIWGVVAFAVWVYMLVTWGACEFSPDTGGEGCPELYVFQGNSVYGTGYYYGRLVTGAVAAILAFVQMTIAARAVDVVRKQKKRQSRKTLT